jgi:hypothetical protein
MVHPGFLQKYRYGKLHYQLNYKEKREVSTSCHIKTRTLKVIARALTYKHETLSFNISTFKSALVIVVENIFRRHGTWKITSPIFHIVKRISQQFPQNRVYTQKKQCFICEHKYVSSAGNETRKITKKLSKNGWVFSAGKHARPSLSLPSIK